MWDPPLLVLMLSLCSRCESDSALGLQDLNKPNLHEYVRRSPSQRLPRPPQPIADADSGLNAPGLEDGGLGGEALLQLLNDGVHVGIGLNLCGSLIRAHSFASPAALCFCSAP